MIASKLRVARALNVGDLVEIRKSGTILYGILEETSSSVSANAIKIVSPNGQLVSCTKNDLSYHIPKWSYSPFIKDHPPIADLPRVSEQADILLKQEGIPSVSAVYHFLQFLAVAEQVHLLCITLAL
jgi:hypothetical protein